MTMINIRRDVNDPFYRYKMPSIIAKVEGKGNGIKTVVVNMADVAKALNRPPSYTTKFFGAEFGAQVILDTKSSRYIINGVHSVEKLQAALDVFISKFVLCPECSNPETHLLISSGVILRDCKACGTRAPVDMIHKISQYILRNPPSHKTVYKQAADSAKSLMKDENQENNSSENKTATEETENNDSIYDSITSEFTTALPSSSSEKHSKAATVSDIEDENDEDPLEVLSSTLSSDPEMTIVEFLGTAAALGIRSDDVVAVYVQTAFDENISTQLQPTGIQFLTAILHEEGSTNPKVLRRCQRALLGSLERLIGVLYPEKLLPKTCAIFQAIYQADLVPDSLFEEWNEKISKRWVPSEAIGKAVRKAAQPFIQWLLEAESEEETETE